MLCIAFLLGEPRMTKTFLTDMNNRTISIRQAVRQAAVCAALAATLTATAVVADPTPRTVTQPDGRTVTLQLHGDEFNSWTLTREGANAVWNASERRWEYARLNAAGQLEAAGIAAADGLVPSGVAMRMVPKTDSRMRAPGKQRLQGSLTDLSRFRGLVILVEYNDAPFTRADYRQVMEDMIMKRDYDGFMTTDLLPSKVECTGSVRDYFFDNSCGKFDPQFDVVGPVKIDISQHAANKTSGAQRIVDAALRAADPMVDYSVYDTDGNRQVDMVYFVFSGGGSNYSGNDQTLIWPHASTVMGTSLDGVSFGRYACSTELYGNPAAKTLDGIGTIVHEFGHVLGLPDLYDTDYETNGQSVHPAKWSVMAGGSYLNKARTPAGYSLYERYALGWANPRVITEAGEYALQPINAGSEADGYRIDTKVKNEYFLLEARNRTRWDEYLPGDGMLVHRVDSTDTKAWDNNDVNINPTHNYYTLLRATPKRSGTGVADSDGDPFPGSGNVTKLDNATEPSLRSWTMVSTPLVLDNIARAADGSVSFTVKSDDVPTLVEDFRTMAPTSADTTGMEGRFAQWELKGGARIESDSTAGSRLTTVKSAEAICSPVDATVENVAITITNPTTSNAVFRLYSMAEGTTAWKPVSTVQGSANPSVKAGSTMTIHYNTGTLVKPRLRLMQYTGNTQVRCTVERVELGIRPGTSGVESIEVEAAGTRADGWYDLQGRPVTEPSAPGLYIRVEGGKAGKVAVR